MICPYHKAFYYTGDECPKCKAGGLVVVQCEIDKIDRVVTTMHGQGMVRHHHSYAVLVFGPSGLPPRPPTETSS